MKLVELFRNDPEVADNKLPLIDGSYLTNEDNNWLIINEEGNTAKAITETQAIVILEY